MTFWNRKPKEEQELHKESREVQIERRKWEAIRQGDREDIFALQAKLRETYTHIGNLEREIKSINERYKREIEEARMNQIAAQAALEDELEQQTWIRHFDIALGAY